MQELLLETLETHTDDMEILPEHKPQADSLLMWYKSLTGKPGVFDEWGLDSG